MESRHDFLERVAEAGRIHGERIRDFPRMKTERDDLKAALTRLKTTFDLEHDSLIESNNTVMALEKQLGAIQQNHFAKSQEITKLRDQIEKLHYFKAGIQEHIRVFGGPDWLRAVVRSLNSRSSP